MIETEAASVPIQRSDPHPARKARDKVSRNEPSIRLVIALSSPWALELPSLFVVSYKRKRVTVSIA
jgi:hypothetical protein